MKGKRLMAMLTTLILLFSAVSMAQESVSAPDEPNATNPEAKYDEYAEQPEDIQFIKDAGVFNQPQSIIERDGSYTIHMEYYDTEGNVRRNAEIGASYVNGARVFRIHITETDSAITQYCIEGVTYVEKNSTIVKLDETLTEEEFTAAWLGMINSPNMFFNTRVRREGGYTYMLGASFAIIMLENPSKPDTELVYDSDMRLIEARSYNYDAQGNSSLIMRSYYTYGAEPELHETIIAACAEWAAGAQ